MTDTSGPTCGKQFAYYDPDSQSWKMWPDTGLWGSIEYSETWPKTGCMSDGQAFELPTLVPPTTGSDCSSSRPPTVFSTPDTMPDAPNSGSNMRTRPPGLGNQVKTLPTPKAHDGIMGRPRTSGRPIEKSTHLGTIVTLLPTPRAARGASATETMYALGATRDDTDRKQGEVTFLPTPVAQPSGNTPEDHLRKKPGRSTVTDLAIIVENDLLKSGGKVLPTPEAKNAHAGPDYARKGRKKSGGDDLVTAITKMSTGAPTPPLFDVGSD